MKKSFLYLLGIVLMATSCMDIADVYNRLDILEKKVAGLEELNSTVSGISSAVTALENNVYVKDVAATADGYVINFTDGTQAVIKDGAAGANGQDGTTPTIGVKEVDGTLVWTVNDQVVKDQSGAAVPATVKVPEFQFENNKWWYRFGPADSWKDCGEKTGPEPSITETDEYVIISIGDNKVQIPKEIISPAIEEIIPVITVGAKRIFVPVGKAADLKDFFEVAPEGALKSMVDYTYPESAAYTVTEKGILTATAAGSSTVTITSKVNPELKTELIIRTGDTPEDTDPKTTITPEQKIKIYEGSIEEYNKQLDFGGTTSYNPFNGAVAGIFTNTLNFRIGMPVVQNTNITMDNGRLHFWFYVSDVSVFTPAAPDAGNFLEHTSSGTYDANEIDYDMRTLIPTLKSGWNEIDLALKDFTAAGGDGKYDPTKASFIRFLCAATGNTDWVTYQMKDLFVYIDDSQITEINPVIKTRNNLFVPQGSSIDLKEFFTVVPEKAGKENVTYTVPEDAPYTISEDGILLSEGAGSYTVTIASAADPNVKLSIPVRSAECPEIAEPASTIAPEEKVTIFSGSLEEYNSMVDHGGSSSWSPVNNAHAAIANGGNINFRLGLPVQANSNLTMENAHLHFMFYVSDPSTLQPAAYDGAHFLEVTSSGTYDVQEVNFELPLFVPSLKAGWNEVDLPFSSANNPNNTGGEFDVTKVSFIRFLCPVSSDGKWIAFMVKDLYAYAAEEEAPVNITIDGDLSDWAGVKGLVSEKSTPVYMEFKVANDENNIYFYTKRDKNSSIWAQGGYVYYEIDADNNPETGENKEHELGLESWLYYYPFGGTASAPEIAESFNKGAASSEDIKNSLQFKGKVSADFVEVEASLPLSVAGITRGTTIRVISWANKSGDDFRGDPTPGLTYDVK